MAGNHATIGEKVNVSRPAEIYRHEPDPFLMNATVSRVTRSKAEAKASYNRLSRWYDLVSGGTERKYRNIGLQMLGVHEGEYVLEIGFGTGHGILALAQAAGSRGRVCGIDLSEGMLAVTQSRIDAAGLMERVDLQVGDAALLPFEEASFDAVFMSFTLELFDTPEIPLVLKQCYGVLRPGGRCAVVSMVRPEKPGLAVRAYEWLHKGMPSTVDCRPILAQADLRQAGFEVREVKALSMWGLPVEAVLSIKR